MAKANVSEIGKRHRVSPLGADEPMKRVWENIRKYDLGEHVAELARSRCSTRAVARR